MDREELLVRGMPTRPTRTFAWARRRSSSGGMSGGWVVTGANVENTSCEVTRYAERAVLAAVISDALAGGSGLATIT